MTIEQTVEIPANHRLTREIPEGKAVIAFTPAPAGQSAEWQKTLAVLKRAHGAWKDHPWENYREDLRAMREEWDHRDPWNGDQAEPHRDEHA
jgi:hypothetical protein